MHSPAAPSGSAYPPPAQGLYDPANERDACGLGFIAHIKGRKTHDDRQAIKRELDMKEARDAMSRIKRS